MEAGYRPWYGQPNYWHTPFYGGHSAYYWSRPWANYHYGWLNGYWQSFTTVPTFWMGLTAGVLSTGSSFAYSNPYYVAPQPQSDTTIVINMPDYSAPIPPPSTEQTVIAFVEAPDPVTTEDGQVALPTTAPPAPPKDETAMDAKGLFEKARELFKAEKFAEAQAEVEKAIQLLPSDAALHEFRSLTLFAQAKYKDAAAGLYAVLAAGPGWNWDTMRGMYQDPAEYTRELRVLEDFSKANPDAGYAHFLRAYHYLVLADKDAAVEQFKEVVRMQPEDKLSSELLKALTSPPRNARARRPDSNVMRRAGDVPRPAIPWTLIPIRLVFAMKRILLFLGLAIAAFAAAFATTRLFNPTPKAPAGMVWIPGGEFVMGSAHAKAPAERAAGPPRQGGRILDGRARSHQRRVSPVRRSDRLRDHGREAAGLGGDEEAAPARHAQAAAGQTGARVDGVHVRRAAAVPLDRLRPVVEMGARRELEAPGRARTRISTAATTIRSCTSRGTTQPPTQSGPASGCRPRRSGSSRLAAGWRARSTPGATTRRPRTASSPTSGRGTSRTRTRSSTVTSGRPR